MKATRTGLLAGLMMAGAALPALADENLLGYLTGAETLPEGAKEAYLWVTQRDDKGIGSYRATDVEVEYEHGLTARLTGAAALKGQSIHTRGILIDGYVPGDESYGLRASGVEAKLKYMFLSPALDPVGLAGRISFEYSWLDPHSGQDKRKLSATTEFLMQKYFLDDQLVAVANLGMESTYARRGEIANLPADFEWTTDPEMEVELKAGVGLAYRIAPRWFVGVETFYETEFETEVGQERWSWHAGPSLHYGDRRWWATLTWMPQLRGGGETYPEQTDTDLHLIEKTRQEFRLKVGYNF
jgi:hypothetical protein